MKVWSLIPMLRYEEGHPYQYNLAVGKACGLNGWKHEALVPRSCCIENLPESWLKVLGNDRISEKHGVVLWKTPLSKLKIFLKVFFPLCKALSKVKYEKGRKVIFLEQFFVPQMVGFTLAMCLMRPKAEVWFVHRYSPEQLGFKAKIYKCMHQLLICFLGKEKIKLFADSELLAKSQREFFRQEVIILPVPHTDYCNGLVKEKKEKDTLLWWPGGYTTVAKGLKVIQDLVKRDLKGNFKLVVADSAREHLKEYVVPIQFISSALSRKEYMKWMNKTDLVLLPYDPEIYHFATSGIFVEAIVAGKIPVVTDGTWMAYELKRFQLQDFIVDWHRKDLFEHFQEILADKRLKILLEKMQKTYGDYHSIQGFADIISKV
ncbi:MAG: hypothetical protein P4L16_01860 [Chlamydiales bacterium]|nr:hypothetical protein [Chlamydiales bacterium]